MVDNLLCLFKMNKQDKKFINQTIALNNSTNKAMLKIVNDHITLYELRAAQDGPWTLRYFLAARKLEPIRDRLAQLRDIPLIP